MNNFPGRAFQIVGMEALKKKGLSKILPNGKANVKTRNFPISVRDIKKKLSIKDGGEVYIFATTLMNNKHILIITKKT